MHSLSVFGFTVDSLLTHTPITQYLYPAYHILYCTPITCSVVNASNIYIPRETIYSDAVTMNLLQISIHGQGQEENKTKFTIIPLLATTR